MAGGGRDRPASAPRGRPAGCLIARVGDRADHQERQPAAAATAATAWLSMSTAWAPVASTGPACRRPWSDALAAHQDAATGLEAASDQAGRGRVAPDRVDGHGRVPGMRTLSGRSRSPGRSSGARPPARPKLTSAAHPGTSRAASDRARSALPPLHATRTSACAGSEPRPKSP